MRSIVNAARCRWPTPVAGAVVNRAVRISFDAVTSSSNSYSGPRRVNHTCPLQVGSEGPGIGVGGSVATSADGAAIAGRTDCNISRISVVSRLRSATAASDAVSCCRATPVAAAGVKRAVGTSGDAVTRGRRHSAADLARCRADCLTGAMLQHQTQHEWSNTKNYCCSHEHKPVLCRDCHARCPIVKGM